MAVEYISVSSRDFSARMMDYSIDGGISGV